MDVIANKKIFLSISGTLVAISITALFLFGLRPAIDFVGGTLWQISQVSEEGTRATTESIREFFASQLGVENVRVSTLGDNDFLIRFGSISENEHQLYLQQLHEAFGEVEEKRYEAIGPSIGAELRKKALWAIALVLIGISLYVAYAFRKTSVRVPSWKYGLITLVTLFHDVIIPVGFFSFLGWQIGIEVDVNFVVAMLVIMGFSVHDTIVIFDRIRENLMISRQKLAKANVTLGAIINASVNQSIARSVNTSLTLVLVLATMLFFGPASLTYFILAILVGTIAGTYSSLFLASPLLDLIASES